MQISDEIRRWCKAGYDIDELRALADRIDSEMVALPKTADGVPVHVGDTAYTYDGDGFEIVQIIIDQDKTRIVCSTGSGLDIMRLPSSVFHTRPDSWKRIADEIEKWCDSVDVDGDACGKPRELADRIRNLAKKEDEDGTD